MVTNGPATQMDWAPITVVWPGFMMTSSNGNIFRVTGHLCGEFTGPRWIPHTKASDAELWDVIFDLPLNKRLSKQSWGWWLETLSRPLWRHRNVSIICFNEEVNSLATRKFEWSLRPVIFKQILVIDGWGISGEIILIWMSLDVTDDQSTLVHVMAWCRQATLPEQILTRISVAIWRH